MDSAGIVDVRLAVTEAATNAVVHAYERVQGELRVSASMHDASSRSSSGTPGPGWHRDPRALAWG